MATYFHPNFITGDIKQQTTFLITVPTCLCSRQRACKIGSIISGLQKVTANDSKFTLHTQHTHTHTQELPVHGPMHC